MAAAGGVLAVLLLLMGSVAFGLGRSLKTATGRLGSVARRVATAAARFSGASRDLAEGASRQSADADAASRALAEVLDMARDHADRAGGVRDTMTERALPAFERMSGQARTMTEAAERGLRESREASGIVRVIDEIAFQSRILALNAAVEASRAGASGAGFAVVAREMTRLAERTATAAADTATLLENSRTEMETVADLATSLGGTVAENREIARGVDAALETIAGDAARQSERLEAARSAMDRIEEIIARNARQAGDSAAASREMNAEATRMAEVAGSLLALVNGSGDRPEPPGRTTRTAGAKTGGKATPDRAGHRPSAAISAHRRPMSHGNGSAEIGHPVRTNPLEKIMA